MADEPEEATENAEKEQHPLAGLKVVVNILDDCTVLIGLTQGAVDPHLESLAISPNDDLADILQAVPEALEKAKEKWTGQPRNPDFKKPTTTPAVRTTRTTTRQARGSTRTDPDVEAPRMF